MGVLRQRPSPARNDVPSKFEGVPPYLTLTKWHLRVNHQPTNVELISYVDYPIEAFGN
jgi:hypothetical protein